MSPTDSSSPDRSLPERPSAEHLRKQAKRLAKALDIGLAAAQRRLASDYGFPSWARLMAAVEAAVGKGQNLPPLLEAALRGDAAAVRDLLQAPTDEKPF